MRSPQAAPVTHSSGTMEWLGGRWQELEGEAFSAYGISKEQGGLVLLSTRKKSTTALAGLKVGDVLQHINGHAVSDTKSLRKADRLSTNQPLTLKTVRDQQPLTIEIKR